MPNVSERNFESIIECALLAGGPDACPGAEPAVREPAPAYGALVPGGYRRRTTQDYDTELCLDPEMVVAFVQATQPKEWAKLKKQYGEQARARFLKRLALEIARRGTLDVLRKGVRDVGARVELVYFRPPSGLNPELQQKYLGNIFTIVRQVCYDSRDASQQRRKSLDMAIFVNGIPLFTVELKNPLTGQSWRDAIYQYRRRDPRESLFAFGRCLAHFAVDPDQVHFATHLQGEATEFFPFNRGRGSGAGNPIPPAGRFATAYLWEQIWARDSVLDLLERFVYEIEEEDDEGRKTGEKRLIFPRYH